MAVEHINPTDSLNTGRVKLNAAIDQSNEAITKATSAETTANQAKSTADNVQAQFNQVVIEGDSSVEAAQARVDADGNTYTTLKERLDTKEQSFSAQLAHNTNKIGILYKRAGWVSVKEFGAKGDGVTDDTQAFKNANLSEYNKTRINTVQMVPYVSMNIYIPYGVYRVKGSKIFGSPVQQGSAGTNLPPIQFKLIGDNATIIWELETPDDELFYFDGTITMPHVEGLNIFVVSENQTISLGGTIFKYFQDANGLGYADASKGYFKNISVWPGRASSNPNFVTKVKRVFYNVGYGMSDQTVVENCRFNYFETAYRGENAEAVNWTFDSCSFYAGGFTNSVYFDFTNMFDNFNVVNCSFSVSANETMLRTRSDIGTDGYYKNGSFYNFNFRDNRIEIYGNPDTTWFLCDMDFGRFNFENSNIRLASGSSNVKTIVSAYGLANLNFENIAFNNVEFRFPISTPQALSGGASASGAILKFCDLINGQYTIKYTDGTTVYNLKDVLISTSLLYRNVKFEKCTLANSNGFLDFEITNNITSFTLVRRTERTINFSQEGMALGKVCLLPPYQTIKNIKISGLPTLPSTYNKFRIYFGDKSLNKYIDVENPKPEYEEKDEFMLWEGIATIFTQDISLQSISVFILNNGVETGFIRSQISVTYEPLDPKTFGISTNADAVIIRTKSKTLTSGNTSSRPSFNLYVGQQYYDTILGKPIWWNGSVWKDAAGNTV